MLMLMQQRQDYWHKATAMAGSFSHRHQPRSPGGGPASPCTSSPTATTSLSTVSSPRLQLSSSGSFDGPSSPRGCRPPHRRDTATTTTTTTAGPRGTQRQSVGTRRVATDTDSSSNLPVWHGANMAQSQLIQRRRRQTQQQKSRVWQHGRQRAGVSASSRYVAVMLLTTIRFGYDDRTSSWRKNYYGVNRSKLVGN